MTCEDVGSGCDYNGDGYNEIYLAELGYGITNISHYIDVFNASCSIMGSYNIKTNPYLLGCPGISTAPFYNQAYKYTHGVWADWNNDNKYEYMFNYISNMSGSYSSDNYISTSVGRQVKCVDSYITLGDINNDDLFDVTWKITNSNIREYSLSTETMQNISGYVISSMYINDTFPYSDNYSNHGWSFTSAYPQFHSYPILSPFSTNAFGYSNTSIVGSTYSGSIYRDLNPNITSGRIILAFDVNVQNDSTASNSPLEIVFYDGNYTSSSRLIFRLVHTSTVSNMTMFNLDGNSDSCGGSIGNVPYTYNIVVDMDIDNNFYSIYVNNTIVGDCFDKNIKNSGPPLKLVRVSPQITVDTSEKLNSTMDNFVLGQGYVFTYISDCVDTDGLDYLTLGSVTTSNITYTDYCAYTLVQAPTTDLYEYVCPFSVDIKTCTDYGSNYICYQGKCTTENVRPIVNSVTSYRRENSSFADDWHNHAWYANNDTVMFKSDVYDLNSDNIYLAVDCDVSNPPFVSSWGPANQTNTTFSNCSYNIGNYTARVWFTDSYYGFSDYSESVDIPVVIRDCVTYHDCPTGYECDTYSGSCYLPSNVTNCTDTDGGLDYLIQGTVTTLWTNKTDNCHNGYTVEEYICSGGPTGYSYTWYDCTNIDSSYTCYLGACQNSTPTAYLSLITKDLDTGASISGISYTFVQYPSYDVVAEGVTPSNGIVTLSLSLGYEYQLILQDLSKKYKDWYEKRFTLTGSINAYMESECNGDCVFFDDFSYADNPYHHGWSGANYSTYYHSDLGFVLDLDTNKSTSEIYQVFPEPTKDVQEIKYQILLTEQLPATGQSVDIHVQDSSDNDIFIMRYSVDSVGTVHVYYFTTSWNEMVLTTTPQPTTAITTTLYYKKSDGKVDIYVDSLSNGNDVLYSQNTPVINANTLGQIMFDPGNTPTYFRHTYINYIDISQSDTTPSETNPDGSPTSPSTSDLSSPWYRNSEGDLKFDASQCSGWKSYIMCAGWKFGVKQVATGTSWIFTGVHILYFIVILIIVVIVGPLLVEFFKKR
jgi:hypothetical protein